MLGFFAAARAGPQDINPLTAEEVGTFLPLVCPDAALVGGQAKAAGYQFACAKAAGYPADTDFNRVRGLPGGRRFAIALRSIIYGAITAPGKDEAYLTVTTSFESHAEGFGGGILLTREKGAWRRVGWYPGILFDDCLAIPGSAPLQMLCETGDGHAGTREQRIFATRADPNRIRVAPDYRLSQPVDVIVDAGIDSCGDEDLAIVPEPCGYWKQGRAFLKNMGDLRHGSGGDAFAVARIDYAAPRDIAEACHRTCILDAKSRTGMLRFTLRGHVIQVDSPFPLQAYEVR